MRLTVVVTFALFIGITVLTEPNGFNAMKFGATRSEIEKVVKLKNCETQQFRNLLCQTTLVVDGSDFRGSVLFAVQHDINTGAQVGDGHLVDVYAAFSKGELAFLKAAFIKKYGTPHYAERRGGESLTWIGNRALIRLFETSEGGSFAVSQNLRGTQHLAWINGSVVSHRE